MFISGVATVAKVTISGSSSRRIRIDMSGMAIVAFVATNCTTTRRCSPATCPAAWTGWVPTAHRPLPTRPPREVETRRQGGQAQGEHLTIQWTDWTCLLWALGPWRTRIHLLTALRTFHCLQQICLKVSSRNSADGSSFVMINRFWQFLDHSLVVMLLKAVFDLLWTCL